MHTPQREATPPRERPVGRLATSMLDAPLSSVADELDRLGYVVVPHGPELCVRLPLLCSVRLRSEAGRVVFRAKFGPFGRTSGLLLTGAASTALVAGTAFAVGFAPATLVVGFAGAVALVIDVCRFVITEGCLTRLQNIVTRT